MAKGALLRKGLDLLYFSGAARALSATLAGVGAIFMLHHVRPGGGAANGFAPNAGLEISPQFLDEVIRLAKSRGYALVSFGEAVRRLKTGHEGEPFACFTIDDAYYDIYEHAWPVFRRHECPFSLFVAPAITDGTCELWWRGLEAVIAGEPRLSVDIGQGMETFVCETDAQKQHVFDRLYWPVRGMPQRAQRHWIRAFCEQYSVNLHAMCRAEAMSWNEVREIAADPLCTLGAHTVNHFAVSKLTPEEVLAEASGSRARIEEETGIRTEFFAYPYGDETTCGPRDFKLIEEAGFEAAVTTRKGLIFVDHGSHLTSLPRVSLNGAFQKPRYVDVLLSGTPFLLWNRFKLMKAA